MIHSSFDEEQQLKGDGIHVKYETTCVQTVCTLRVNSTHNLKVVNNIIKEIETEKFTNSK